MILVIPVITRTLEFITLKNHLKTNGVLNMLTMSFLQINVMEVCIKQYIEQ